MLYLPNQQVARAEKEKDSFYKPTYDYYINRALSLNNKDKITAWLEAANGVISNDSINYLISPLKDKETQRTLGKLPGELRDTDLINMVRERNMGEYIGLPYKFTVNVSNADATLRRDLQVREEVNKLMQQALVNMLNEYYQENENAINTGMPSKELPDIELFAKDFIENWIDDRAINGLHILNLINAVNDFDTKRIQSFFYWWATEEFYTYREIINNEVYTSNISPLEGFPIYNDQQFVEDYDGFVIRKRTTLSQIKANYWHELSDIEKNYLEQLTRRADGTFTVKGQWLATRTWYDTKTDYTSNPTQDFDITDSYEAIYEYTVIWRTDVPIKIRTFLDPFGREMEEVVPEDYVQDPELDVAVRTEWIQEVYIGKRFGNEVTGVYLKPVPCDVQRYDKHTMIPKLPVGGKKGILRNIHQNPIPRRLSTFALIDRMILIQQERVMAKYEGYIKVIPKSMLNDDITGTKNEKMFYIKADNTLFYDDTSIDFNTVAQGFRVVNMPDVANYLKTLIDLRDKYKAEALEIANMNSYALGDVMASTGKGVMQESIYRARIGNVLSLTMFHAALERDHMADLEFSKVAYQDDIRGNYSDRGTGKPIYIDVNIQEHRETDYGVIVENSKIDEQKIDMFRQIAFNASQNGDIDSAVAAVEYDSIPELRKALKEISKAQKELEAAMEEQRNETQRYVADKANEKQEAINATQIEVANIQAEAAMYAADRRAESAMMPSEEPIAPVEEDSTNIQREALDFKREDANAKNQLREKEIRLKDQANRDRNKIASQKKNNK